MHQIRISEMLVLLGVALLWAIPIGAGIWIIRTIHLIRSGQEAIQKRLEAIERLLQNRSTDPQK